MPDRSGHAGRAGEDYIRRQDRGRNSGAGNERHSRPDIDYRSAAFAAHDNHAAKRADSGKRDAHLQHHDGDVAGISGGRVDELDMRDVIQIVYVAVLMVIITLCMPVIWVGFRVTQWIEGDL